jgi:hypothetical protein
MSPYACDKQEQTCRCDLCTRRVRTVLTESPDASPLDADARGAEIDWATVKLLNWRPGRLVPRK